MSQPINYSTGIVLHYSQGSQIYVVLVRRRTSYAFMDFCGGSYFAHQRDEMWKRIAHMVNYMTPDEKDHILSRSFSNIYYHAWGIDPEVTVVPNDKRTRFTRERSRYQSLIDADGGKRLTEIVKSASSISCLDLFELPKGKCRIDEDTLAAAKREVYEETNFVPDLYVVNQNMNYRHTYTAPDNQQVYTTDYYFAQLSAPAPSLAPKQTNWQQRIEISEIRAFSSTVIRELFPQYRPICDVLNNYYQDVLL